MIQITHIRLTAAGTKHEHITDLRWYSPVNGNVQQITRTALIEWLRKPGTRAYICDGKRMSEVGIVDAQPPYLRSIADGYYTDNLLALPRF